jgi:hypothetical protein
MPIEVYWDKKDKTIIRARLTDGWTWEDYSTASEKMRDMARQVDYRVDMITDLRQSGPIPRGSASAHILRSRQQKPPNFGLTVLVGADVFLKALLEVFDRVYGRRVPRSMTVETIAEARALIAGARAQADKDAQV